MLIRLITASLWLSLLASVSVQGDLNTNANLHHFKSRPDLYPPRLFVNTTQDGVTPGYIFMAPYQSFQNSAAIYDSEGTLLWYGYGITGAGNAHDFRVCQYNGSDHLCFYQGEQHSGYARGQAVIMNTDLRLIRTVTALNGLSALDQHEFNIVGDSALTTIYTPQRYDLSALNITGGEGWIQNSVFQDINLTTGELNFEWSAIEHVALSEGYVSPNQSEVAGSGFSAISPWDYFHINSVDKDDAGDYLVSARHVSTLYKINGQDGSIIWRCGGKLSDFEPLSGLNWSYQHDARWLSQNDSTEIISFFDNASNGHNQSASHSAGYIIKLDHTATPPTVELLLSYSAPEEVPISASQGNLQILNPDDWQSSNAFVGWGSQPYITEHAPDGEILYQANVAANGMMNYRAYKYNITLTPYDSPALYSYAQSEKDATVFYMSWNGATQLRRWRIYGRAACDDKWILLDEVDKTDFETNYTVSTYQEFGMVEAVSADGTGLKNSTNRGIKAFVPSAFLSASCGPDDCNATNEYSSSPIRDVVEGTRAGCAALPVSIADTTVDASASSGKQGYEFNSGMTPLLSVGLASSLFIGLVL